MKNVLLIINPKSGKLKSKSALFDIVNIMSSNGCIVTPRITSGCGDAKKYAEYACESGFFDSIVCSGGDGTLSETVSGIIGSSIKLPLGFIPSGSTNDYAKSLGIPSDIPSAALIAAEGDIYPIDIGKIDGRNFNYIASFGAFTSASYNAPQTLKNLLGHMAYVLEGIKDIGKIKSYTAKIESDSKIYEGDYIFGAVANSTSLGGIVKLKDTLVEFNDGVFEVCLVKKPKNPAEMIKIVMGTLNSDFSSPCFEFFRTSGIKFLFKKKINWSLDGEKYISDKKAEINVIHDAVKLILKSEEKD